MQLRSGQLHSAQGILTPDPDSESLTPGTIRAVEHLEQHQVHKGSQQMAASVSPQALAATHPMALSPSGRERGMQDSRLSPGLSCHHK